MEKSHQPTVRFHELLHGGHRARGHIAPCGRIEPIRPAFCDQIRRSQQRVKRPRVGPPPLEDAMGEGSVLQVLIVDVGNLESPPP